MKHASRCAEIMYAHDKILDFAIGTMLKSSYTQMDFIEICDTKSVPTFIMHCLKRQCIFFFESRRNIMKDSMNIKWKQMEILCIIIVSFFLILLVRMIYQPNAASEANSFVSLSSGWYQIKNG